jgi:DNA-binding TFAR19-related protein (PDSD5 family)
MSDSELDMIRRRKLLELQRRAAAKENKVETLDSNEVLNRVFRGRAWEVFSAASYQFPQVMTQVRALLVKLALSGKIKEVTGEQLHNFLTDLGLRVRLETKIEFASNGELKSLAEKMRETLREK